MTYKTYILQRWSLYEDNKLLKKSLNSKIPVGSKKVSNFPLLLSFHLFILVDMELKLVTVITIRTVFRF